MDFPNTYKITIELRWRNLRPLNRSVRPRDKESNGAIWGPRLIQELLAYDLICLNVGSREARYHGQVVLALAGCCGRWLRQIGSDGCGTCGIARAPVRYNTAN